MDTERFEVSKGPLVSAPRGPLLTSDIERFRSLYKSEFGIELSEEVAYEKAIKLLRLMSIIYRPMSNEEYEAIQKHRESTKGLLGDGFT